MTGRAASVIELAEASEAVDRAYAGWLDDPCRRTVEEVERAAAMLKAVAASVGRREAAAEWGTCCGGRPSGHVLPDGTPALMCDEACPCSECERERADDHGAGCDGPGNCVCEAWREADRADRRVRS